MEFVNRKKELCILDTRYESNQAEFLVVTGRRRVGKTSVLAQFARQHQGIYFLGYLDSEESLLQQFSQLIYQSEYPDSKPDDAFTYGSWLGLFRAIGRLAQNQRLVVIIDEYPYLVGSSQRLASQLQKVWDEILQHSQIYLVICGSYISVMKRDLLDRDAPLHGRRTGQLFVQPLTVWQAAEFLPNYTPLEIVDAYAVAGGTPAYLRQLSDQRDIWDNIRYSVLNRGSMLYNEPDLLLRDELREPRLYAAILRAIAAGNHQLKKIATAAGIESSNSVSSYLDLLKSLRWVEHRVPLGSTRHEGQRWGTWHLVDAYIRFWARYVLPHVRRLEYDEADELLYELIRPTWAQFVGVVWEDIARQHLPLLSKEREIPFWPEEVGSWWSAKAQIDLVGVNYADRLAVLGEARWREEKVGVRYFNELEKKADHWLNNQSGWKLFYVFYSKRGFTDDLVSLAAQQGSILLKTPDDVIPQQQAQ
ncbi:MAG: ATP-binding protein [Chloroflexota bacterium]